VFVWVLEEESVCMSVLEELRGENRGEKVIR
jgi:hypothetical protein